MRLLHSTNLTFYEIFEQQIPQHPYAILSHRWGTLTDEVSYEEFLARSKDGSPGFRKIKSFCEWAASNMYQWVWIDTCCIDKRSSAELSEAINSMFSWYKQSAVCVVYLKTVNYPTDDFTEDEWFNRGWTLQELVAPQKLIFVTANWELIGQRKDPRIVSALSTRTGIPKKVLSYRVDVRYISVARRMSWMAYRTTTRIEDMAYCLLGIFGVNMPLLYDEGWKAFQRLQLQIMEQDEDESIFSWSMQDRHAADSAFHGLLAQKPAQFAHCGGVITMVPRHDPDTPSMRVNAREIEFCAGLLQSVLPHGETKTPVILHQLRCAFTTNSESHLDVYVSESALGDDDIRPCFIALSRKTVGAYSRVRVRQLPWSLATFEDHECLARQPRRSFRGVGSLTSHLATVMSLLGMSLMHRLSQGPR